MAKIEVPLMDAAEFSSWLETHMSNADKIGNLYPPDKNDLYSLYLKMRKGKCIAVIEYGSGWSTLVLAQGIYENFQEDEGLVENYQTQVRHPNPFRVLTIDASQHFQGLALERLEPQLLEIVSPVVADVTYGTFLGRICTYF